MTKTTERPEHTTQQTMIGRNKTAPQQTSKSGTKYMNLHATYHQNS